MGQNMDELTCAGFKRMTVKEVAEALGTAESTIRNKARELFPEVIENGKTSYFTEGQAFLLKKALVPRDLTFQSKVDSIDQWNGILTMDSREIAMQVGKDHAHVCRDIREMFEAAQIDQSKFGSIYQDSYGRDQKCYKLPAHELMLLLTGYSVPLRDKVLRRWEELERSCAPVIPRTYAEALQLAANQAKELEAKETALAIAGPKIEGFEALMKSGRCMSITDAAKHFGLHPKVEVFPYLREHGYLTRDDLPTQAAIDAGYLALRETKCPDGEVRKQAVVLDSQLDTWRLRVIPQIAQWIKLSA